MQITANGKRLPILSRQKLLVMKLLMIFTCVTCLYANANMSAQTVTLNAKQSSLEKVLREVRKQTGYAVVFNNNVIASAKPVTIDASNMALDQFLKECFKDQPLQYEILQNKTIVIKEKKLQLIMQENANSAIPAMPPATHDISGKITDESGNPLSGASIKIKGTQQGASTNADGVFVLKNVDEKATIEISYIGYETMTVPVGVRTSFTVSLVSKETSLQDVVVNKGYYTEKMRNNLGNVTSIKAADIEKQPVMNPLLALQGRVPGLEVTQLSGMNGGGVTVRIQGQNSILSGNDPLVVIDGVPFLTQLTGAINLEDIVKGGSPLNYINPNDIESIDILKDADATAIYGSRAANGALLITTKKGKEGKSRFGVSLQTGWATVGHKVDMMNTRQYLDMRYEAFRNSGTSIYGTTPTSANYDLTLWDTTRYTDWQKTLIGGTAANTVVNASLSGGTKQVQYLLGATYKRQSTVFPGNYSNSNANVNFNLSSSSANDRFKVQFSTIYMFDNNGLPNGDLTQQALLLAPNAPALYNTDGTYNWALNAAGSSSWTNPLANYTISSFSNSTRNIVASASLSYELLKGLVLSARGGYTDQAASIFTMQPFESIAPESRSTTSRRTNTGERSQGGWSIEPQIQYKRTIGKGTLDALIGTSIQKNYQRYLVITGTGYASDQIMRSLVAATSFSIGSNYELSNSFNAGYGRIGYNWDGKYLVNFSMRRDGSSKFGDSTKFHNFSSIAAGWIVSEEPWFKNNLSTISFAKLKASYGTTGNDQIPDFSYISTYGISRPDILYQGGIGLIVQKIPNPYLQWEETRKWSFGLDLGLLKDRINLGVNYAYNVSNNQLMTYILPIQTGFNTVAKNVPATIQNTSLELVANSINIKSKSFQWRTSVNLTIPRNKLVSFEGMDKVSLNVAALGLFVGQPLGTIAVYRYAGVNPGNGQYTVYDQNNVAGGFFTGGNNQYINTRAKYYGGLVNTITYKDFQLDFMFQFVNKLGPRDMYFNNGSYYPGQFSNPNQSNQPVTALNRWQKPGDNAPIARYYTSVTGTNIGSTIDAYYMDASYLRLKNVSLSWVVPQKYLQRVRLQGAQLYLHAQNLLTFTKYTGLDPESGTTGLPPLRTITVGAKLDL